MNHTFKGKGKSIVIFYMVAILFIAFFTYFRNYDYPKELFWDENYHIASAEKYLKGMFFMESHAPLGKMLIALGEYLIHPNDAIDKSSFLKTDYITSIPDGYSFKGVRFFPVFFATIGSVLFFLILCFILGHAHFAALLSSLYLFENAFILHSRGAMLESSQMFFFFLSLLVVVIMMKKKEVTIRDFFILGLSIGASISIQWMGLVAAVALPFLLFRTKPDIKTIRHIWRRVCVRIVIFIIGVILPFLGFYYLHVFLGKNIVENKTYEASSQYIQALEQKKVSNVSFFPVALRDHLTYVKTYNAGIPKSDICKYPDENGTTPWVWPVGDKAINYRWEKDGNAVRYLYLIGNPIIWATSLVSILLSFVLVASRYVFGLKPVNKDRFRTVLLFVLMYVCFMAAMISMETQRAFYLYHYLMGLMISLFLSVALFGYVVGEKIQDKPRSLFIYSILFVFCVVVAYLFFSPFTYYQALTTNQFQLRNWFPFWKLTPVL